MTTLNINIGVLGHVDSGKTSLAKALSTTASTAAFDKNPQSKERGITLDLGFSSFSLDYVPVHFQNEKKEYTNTQFTLVDCPGHASLIKTIIGGAQIIDLMLLVIDIVKGIQTQTAECLIIGEITCEKMIIVLNKVDLIPESKREQTIEKMKKRLWKTLENGPFKNCPIVEVAANPSSDKSDEFSLPPVGIPELINVLINTTPNYKERYMRRQAHQLNRNNQRFIFSVDHCFAIRGQGTVMTGTVLSGSIKVGDIIEIPSLKMERKIKSMQMFRKPVEVAKQNDRVGLCVTQFDPSSLERGLVSTPGTLPTIFAAIISVNAIPYFKSTVSSKTKFHITMGHETVLARITIFAEPSVSNNSCSEQSFSLDQDYFYCDQLDRKLSEEVINGEANKFEPGRHFILVELDHPITCVPDCLVIGSRLDSDIHSNTCRLAFHGRLLVPIEQADYKTSFLPKLKIFKEKQRVGHIERVTDSRSVIVKNLFRKETNLELFRNLRVVISPGGQTGRIEGSFGQSGKCKIFLDDDLPSDIVERFSGNSKRKLKDQSKVNDSESMKIDVIIRFKRYIYDSAKRMIQ